MFCTTATSVLAFGDPCGRGYLGKRDRSAAQLNVEPSLPPTSSVTKPAVDKSIERVQTKLASMLKELELKNTEVETDAD